MYRRGPAPRLNFFSPSKLACFGGRLNLSALEIMKQTEERAVLWTRSLTSTSEGGNQNPRHHRWVPHGVPLFPGSSRSLPLDCQSIALPELGLPIPKRVKSCVESSKGSMIVLTRRPLSPDLTPSGLRSWIQQTSKSHATMQLKGLALTNSLSLCEQAIRESGQHLPVTAAPGTCGKLEFLSRLLLGISGDISSVIPSLRRPCNYSITTVVSWAAANQSSLLSRSKPKRRYLPLWHRSRTKANTTLPKSPSVSPTSKL